MAGAFPPLDAPLLAPLSLGLLSLLVRDCGLRRIVVLGYAFGLVHVGLLTWWLWSSISPWAWMALTVTVSLWWAVAAALMAAALRLPFGPCWAAAMWTGVELMRQQFPLGGFPWGRVGFAVVDSTWAGLLPFVGVTGASFVLALVGIAWAEAVHHRGRRTPVLALSVTALSLLPAVWPYVPARSGAITVAAVQPGIPGGGNDVLRDHRAITDQLTAATTRLTEDATSGVMSPPHVVVWPESSTARDPFQDPVSGAAFDEAARSLESIGATLMVGAIVGVGETDRVVNQSMTWTSSGAFGARYTKRHPVPFGEYVPFRSVLGGVSDLLDQVPRDMMAGAGTEPVWVAGVSIAAAICFDVGFDDVVLPQVRSGAELLVVQTSNASFVGTSQLEQQFVITRARAAEAGRAAVVASINGVSGLIDPDGRVVRRTTTDGPVVLTGELALSTSITPAARLAPVLPWAVGLLASIGVVAGWFQARGSGQSTSRRGGEVAGRSLSRRRLSL